MKTVEKDGWIFYYQDDDEDDYTFEFDVEIHGDGEVSLSRDYESSFLTIYPGGEFDDSREEGRSLIVRREDEEDGGGWIKEVHTKFEVGA